jgi:NAD-dependent dihydropyrimidine dehydrogenase PreA subunit
MPLRYLSDVVTLELDSEKCIGCGTCTEVCPHRVFTIGGKKARILDRDACMECGACAKNCPVDAIAVRAGVGCAAAVLAGALREAEPRCGCPDGSSTSCCG